MYFEGRELKPYAEPVSSAELKEGEVYFTVNYVDEEMLIPVMETLVFVGRNFEPRCKPGLFSGFRFLPRWIPLWLYPPDELAHFEMGSENETNHIFTFEHALEGLMKCWLKRKKKGI